MSSKPKPLIIRDLSILGIYQLAGGIYGLILLIIQFFSSLESLDSLVLVALYSLFFILFSFSVYCGMICIKKEKHALIFSRINQALQLVIIYAQFISFTYVAGLGIFAGINLASGIGLTFEFHFSLFSFWIQSETENKTILINLVAVYLLYNFNVLIREERLKAEFLPDLEKETSE